MISRQYHMINAKGQKVAAVTNTLPPTIPLGIKFSNYTYAVQIARGVDVGLIIACTFLFDEHQRHKIPRRLVPQANAAPHSTLAGASSVSSSELPTETLSASAAPSSAVPVEVEASSEAEVPANRKISI